MLERTPLLGLSYFSMFGDATKMPVELYDVWLIWSVCFVWLLCDQRANIKYAYIIIIFMLSHLTLLALMGASEEVD